jgi:hypothetical protein
MKCFIPAIYYFLFVICHLSFVICHAPRQRDPAALHQESFIRTEDKPAQPFLCGLASLREFLFRL